MNLFENTIGYSTMALAAGLLIGSTYAINARLGSQTSPIVASFWGHFLGAIFLTGILFLDAESLALVKPIVFKPLEFRFSEWGIPPYTYLAAVISVSFVFLSSWLYPKLGGILATLLIISGQMTIGTVIDFLQFSEMGLSLRQISAQILGIGLILAGMTVPDRLRASNNPISNKKS